MIYLVFLHWLCKFDMYMYKYFNRQYVKHGNKLVEIANKIDKSSR